MKKKKINKIFITKIIKQKNFLKNFLIKKKILIKFAITD